MDATIVSPQDMVKILPGNAYSDAMKFIDLGLRLNCKFQTRYAKANKYWRCVYTKKKPSRVLFTVECTEQWWRVKAMLSNIKQYTEQLDKCSDTLKNIIKTAYDCHICNSYCKRSEPFVFDGIEYMKCIGCSYYFLDLNNTDQNSLIGLIELDSLY